MRRGWFVLFCVVVSLLAMPTARADVPIVVFDGQGWGHGVGLSQWGAEFQARHGASTAQIVGGFYPGTKLETRQGQVRVSVHTSPNGSTRIAFPSGGEIRSALGGQQASGFPVRIAPGGSVQISYNGTYRVTPLVGALGVGDAVVFNDTAAAGGCIPFVNCPTTTTTTTRPPSGGGGGNGGGNGGGGGGGGGGNCGLLLCPKTTTTTSRPATTTTTAPPNNGPGVTSPTTAAPTTTPPGGTPSTTPPDDAITSSNPVWAVPAGGGATTALDRGRSYRGVIEATARSGPLRLLNQLDVETYLKGMGEVPGSWPIAAIGAQSIVARTYALRAMAFSGELCDYDLCQVYVGTSKETAGQAAAVDATRGQVLTFNGDLASTVYSADAGGVSATTFEGFGTPDGIYPYLTTVPYETDNPLPWRSEIALTDLASRFGYRGTLSDVFISDAGPSGRALEVTLRGDAGDITVEGRRFSSKLGLKSTLWERTMSSSDSAPPPPPAFDFVQALPEDTEAITAAATQGEELAIVEAEVELDAAAILGALTEIDFSKAVTELAEEPVALFAVGLLGIVTAIGMSQWGLVPAGVTLIGDRRRRPTLVLPQRRRRVS